MVESSRVQAEEAACETAVVKSVMLTMQKHSVVVSDSDNTDFTVKAQLGGF